MASKAFTSGRRLENLPSFVKNRVVVGLLGGLWATSGLSAGEAVGSGGGR